MAATQSCFTPSPSITYACPVSALPKVRREWNTTQKYPPAATGANVGSKLRCRSRAPAANG